MFLEEVFDGKPYWGNVDILKIEKVVEQTPMLLNGSHTW